jgi:hypothetical protein
MSFKVFDAGKTYSCQHHAHSKRPWQCRPHKADPAHSTIPLLRLQCRNLIRIQLYWKWSVPSTSTRGRLAKKPNLCGCSLRILASASFLSRDNCFGDIPGGNTFIAGRDKIALSIPDASKAFKLISGDQGRCSSGVFHPSDLFTSALFNDAGKKWWWTSMRMVKNKGSCNEIKWLAYIHGRLDFLGANRDGRMHKRP